MKRLLVSALFACVLLTANTASATSAASMMPRRSVSMNSRCLEKAILKQLGNALPPGARLEFTHEKLADGRIRVEAAYWGPHQTTWYFIADPRTGVIESDGILK